MQLSRPLEPHQRSLFLETLATRLNGQREPGDGSVFRLCRELQKEFFDPPQFVSDNGGKYDGKANRQRRARSA